MLTDKEALNTAKNELDRAIYLSECSRSAGIRAINKEMRNKENEKEDIT